MSPSNVEIERFSHPSMRAELRGNACCVVGMHRSGTSMIAKLLHACGISIGPEGDLKLATRHNTAGHWENLAFVALNNDLLHQFGGDWHKPPMFCDGWEFSAEASRFVKNANDLLNQFRGPWGWKDPRNSLTLPFWLRMIPDLKVIVCLRNPLEVSRSLFLRDSQDLSPFDLWATHYRNAISATSPEQRLVTHYESYFANPHAELRTILDWLNINVPNETV